MAAIVKNEAQDLVPEMTEDTTPVNATCQDLIVFSYAQTTDSLMIPLRTFKFFDKDVRIKQAWTSGGRGGSAIGFGCSVYNCSFVLSHYLEAHPQVLSDKHVLELGCGPGLLSIVAGLSGVAASVCATDGDDISVALTEENIQANNVNSANIDTSSSSSSSSSSSNSSNNKCTARRLLWGDTSDLQAFTAEGRQYDLILAADVVAVPYESAYDDLLLTFESLLAPTGVLLLCYQQRHRTEEKFFRRLRRAFSVTQCTQEDLHADFQKLLVPVQLFRVTRHGST